MSVNPGIIHSLIEKSVTVKYPNEIIRHFQLVAFVQSTIIFLFYRLSAKNYWKAI